MKKLIYIMIFIIIVYIILGFFLNIIPTRAPAGYHGRNGEFCGIRYTPDCDVIVTRFFKWDEAIYLYTDYNNK